MSELVTGEAVALELRPARLPSRALAVLIDLAAVLAVYIGVSVGLVFASASLDDAAQAAVSIAAFLLVLVGGPIAVETLSHGRSLGKLALGLRVVRDDGGPIRFRHALVRGAIGVVEILMTFGVVACVASLVSARGRRLGDVFAGTLVVRERVASGRLDFVPPPPPWLVGRFSTLDLSAVPDGLWLAVRQYLTRMHQLDPQVGWAMAQRLADDVAARTGAPAPPGVPPAMYLAAVVDERRTREARRAFGDGPGGGGSAGADGGADVGGTAAPAGQEPFTGAPAHGTAEARGWSAPRGWATPSLPDPAAAGPSGSPYPAAEPSGSSPTDAALPEMPSRAPAPVAPAAVPEDAARAGRPATGFVPPA
ncbi:RDD family protein [Streptomyces sp. NPDC046831]|uniref:RDD family protein n=1 Tax=Streptomyces sp. NPDC046831 TaxID=3154805 RepID=UPI0033FB0EBC